MKKYLIPVLKHMGKFSVCALMVAANTTSTWILHQPEAPEGIKEFKRI